MKSRESNAITLSPKKIQLLIPNHRLLEQFENLHRAIERRAYEIFKNSGFTDGHDLEDWLKAESEFLQPAPLNIEETDSAYFVRVAVPGFQEKEIEVGVGPDRVIVCAERSARSEHKEDKAVTIEQRLNSICREVSLPSNIEPHLVTRRLLEGVLLLTLPKAPTLKAKSVAA